MRTHPPIVDAGGVERVQYFKKKLEAARNAKDAYFATTDDIDLVKLEAFQYDIVCAERGYASAVNFLENAMKEPGGVSVLYFNDKFEPDSLKKFIEELEFLDVPK